jgi:hypothetical protein
MLPHSYQFPAAILLVLSGALTCFAGYRLFRIVLAIYGFVLGALVGSSMASITSNASMLVAALVGGAVGALILVFAYFVGIALVGAGLGALLAHLAWGQISRGDPPAMAVIALSAIGAVAAILLQRYVIIVGTAFGGAWTVIVGAAVLMGPSRAAGGASDPWILYPLAPAIRERWAVAAWVVLGLVGTAVQLGITARKRR